MPENQGAMKVRSDMDVDGIITAKRFVGVIDPSDTVYEAVRAEQDMSEQVLTSTYLKGITTQDHLTIGTTKGDGTAGPSVTVKSTVGDSTLSTTTEGTVDTLSVVYGTAAGTACEGNDLRLSNTREPNPHAWSSGNGYGVASTTEYGHVKVGSNISVDNGTISITDSNVNAALGYTASNSMQVKITENENVIRPILLSADTDNSASVNNVTYLTGRLTYNDSTQSFNTPKINGYVLDTACAKDVIDNTVAAAASSSGTKLPTERTVYHALPTINNSHSYTSSTNIYAPTAGGTSGQILLAQGATSTPVWTSPSNITSGFATKIGDGSTNIGSAIKPVHVVNGVVTECDTLVTTANTNQTVSGVKTFSDQLNATGGLTIGAVGAAQNMTQVGNFTMTGNLTINGDITVNGSSYETHAEQVYSANDYIILRDGATGSLDVGSYAGLQVEKYDGTSDCILAVDNTGTARVGDVSGSIQPLLTRAEATAMDSGGVMIKWDSTNIRAVTASSADVFAAAGFSSAQTSEITPVD